MHKIDLGVFIFTKKSQHFFFLKPAGVGDIEELAHQELGIKP